MDFDRDQANTDDYFVTALQIFGCCGVDSSGSIRVDALMDKFTPVLKTNKAEFSFLKKLLDPDQSNPDINVTKLAKALHKYSESHKTKVDLDESFNLKCAQAPHDSDSGISTDGIQLLEELQCELKEKEHLAHLLRSQLDFTDRQHEEALATVTAERDSLLRHLNVIREENAILSHLRRDYDEACERLCTSETALKDTKKELDTLRKKTKLCQEQVAQLESDKLTLQELLSKSKLECHRINEMYAARQSALLGENETLRAERAELSTRAQDQEDFMQQIIKEKVLLEMELKDVLNKSNHTHLQLDRSIDVSYTEEQMLTVLDSINANSQFSQDHTSVSTQVEVPCADCEKRNAVVPHRTLRKFFWDPLKRLFQLFAIICFLCAIWILSGVARPSSERCRAAPWSWLHVQEFVDLLLRIEYTSEVPM